MIASITPEGVVKILDFGLAHSMELPPEEASPENSPTHTIGATEAAHKTVLAKGEVGIRDLNRPLRFANAQSMISSPLVDRHSHR